MEYEYHQLFVSRSNPTRDLNDYSAIGWEPAEAIKTGQPMIFRRPKATCPALSKARDRWPQHNPN